MTKEYTERWYKKGDTQVYIVNIPTKLPKRKQGEIEKKKNNLIKKLGEGRANW